MAIASLISVFEVRRSYSSFWTRGEPGEDRHIERGHQHHKRLTVWPRESYRPLTRSRSLRHHRLRQSRNSDRSDLLRTPEIPPLEPSVQHRKRSASEYGQSYTISRRFYSACTRALARAESMESPSRSASRKNVMSSLSKR